MIVRDVLDLVYLGNPLRGWLTAAGVLAGVFVGLVLARHVLVHRLERRAPLTSTQLDDLALSLARGTSKLFLLAASAAAARKALFDLPADVKDAVVLVARLALYLQAAGWANIAVGFWVARMTRERAEHDKASLATLNLLGVLARVALGALLVLLALDAFGVDITALVTGLGIAGVAVALAVQNVLGDLLASLAIALDKPFVIGDTIAFDQYTGTVENIGLKTTRLRALSGEQLVVANAELLKARIRNFQRQAERRVQFTLTFPLDTPPAAMARVPEVVRAVVAEQPQVRLDRSHFAALLRRRERAAVADARGRPRHHLPGLQRPAAGRHARHPVQLCAPAHERHRPRRAQGRPQMARVRLVDHQGDVVQGRKALSLCRCGASTKKPFCDGTHSKVGFRGAEAAQAACDAGQAGDDGLAGGRLEAAELKRRGAAGSSGRPRTAPNGVDVSRRAMPAPAA